MYVQKKSKVKEAATCEADLALLEVLGVVDDSNSMDSNEKTLQVPMSFATPHLAEVSSGIYTFEAAFQILLPHVLCMLFQPLTQVFISVLPYHLLQ